MRITLHNTPGYQTVIGFCQDSLNSLKVILGNFPITNMLIVHRSDSDHGSDYIVILFDFKFYMTKVENLKHTFSEELN